MRQIVLDTETTGLNARLGDRIVEIGCIELNSRRVGEQRFHQYLNPERAIDEGAARVHGLTLEFLSDKPKFAQIAQAFIEFVQGAEVLIHNAAFDVEFLDCELKLVGLPPLATHVACVTDTLALARERHPGKRNSLDALCERYAIENAHRTLHGALLDAALLAEVYLAMTRGQESLISAEREATTAHTDGAAQIDATGLDILYADAKELAEHERLLKGIDKDSKGQTIWRALT